MSAEAGNGNGRTRSSRETLPEDYEHHQIEDQYLAGLIRAAVTQGVRKALRRAAAFAALGAGIVAGVLALIGYLL